MQLGGPYAGPLRFEIPIEIAVAEDVAVGVTPADGVQHGHGRHVIGGQGTDRERHDACVEGLACASPYSHDEHPHASDEHDHGGHAHYDTSKPRTRLALHETAIRRGDQDAHQQKRSE